MYQVPPPSRSAPNVGKKAYLRLHKGIIHLEFPKSSPSPRLSSAFVPIKAAKCLRFLQITKLFNSRNPVVIPRPHVSHAVRTGGSLPSWTDCHIFHRFQRKRTSVGYPYFLACGVCLRPCSVFLSVFEAIARRTI